MGRLVDSVRSFLAGPMSLRDPALVTLFGSGPTASGANVTGWTALNYSAWWAATQIISNAVATLPLKLFRRTGPDSAEEMTSQRLYRILHRRFNPEMSSFQARKTMQAHVLTWGNAYAEIERDISGRAVALWPLTPDRVRPDRDNQGNVIYRVYGESGTEVVIRAADMIHVAGLGFDGLCGYSVIQKARESVGLAIATERYGAQFFGNGAVASLVASHPMKLSPTAYQNLRESLERQMTGDKKHGMLLLEEGIKVEKTSIPPDDAQFLETRKFSIVEVARWFNLPPHKLAEMDRATFSNIEHQAIEFVVDTLMPHLESWEQELDFKLIAPLEQTQQFIKHNLKGQLRGDTTARGAWYALGKQWGWLSTNDIRRLEDMNPIGEEGDVYLVPTNMAPADRLDEIIDKQVAPDPAPQPPAPAPEPVAANGNGNRPQRAENAAKVIAAQRAAFLDTMGRMVRREGQAVRRAAKKGPDAFRQWCAEFYPKHATLLRNTLAPAVQMHLTYVAATIGSQEATQRLVDEYIEQSQGELKALPTNEMENAVDRLVSRWETQRPSQVADALMTEELTHVLGAQ